MTVVEQLWRRTDERHTIRPFVENAKVRCRGYSLGLERVVSDFGADESFVRAAAKVKEHYQIELCPGTLRQVTQKHGSQMQSVPERKLRLPASGVQELVAEQRHSRV